MCRAIRKEKAGSADFDLTIRAAELRHERRDLKEIVVLSLDADFVSILSHVQLHDLYGVGMIDPQAKFADHYRNIVDITIEMPDFLKGYDYARVKRGVFGIHPTPKPKPSKSAVASAPKAAAKSTPRFDVASTAALIVRHAEANDIVYLGHESVRRILQKSPGFMVSGRPWAGDSYRRVIESIVARNSHLELEKRHNGGVVLVHKAARSSASATSAAP